MTAAHQGEVWLTDLDPVLGHEQAGRRPALVVSVDQLGTGRSELAIVVPLTRTDSGQRLHVQLDPPTGGLRAPSFAMPEQLRSISRHRLVERWGVVDGPLLVEVLRRARLLLRDPR